MGAHIISYNTKINVPNIQNTYATKTSSIFDSPDQDQLHQAAGSKIYETQYKIMISEGQTGSKQQRIADVHRVTNSGNKYKMTVENNGNGREDAGFRENIVNST